MGALAMDADFTHLDTEPRAHGMAFFGGDGGSLGWW